MGGAKQWRKKGGEEHRVLLELFATSIIHPGNWDDNDSLRLIHKDPAYPFHTFSERVFLTKVKEIAAERQQNIELGADELTWLCLLFSSLVFLPLFHLPFSLPFHSRRW